MASMPVMPRTGEWTVDDLDRIPDDGLQYELADGVLLVTPAPALRHQRACAGVYDVLRADVPDDLIVLFAPVDFRPTRQRSLQPDVLLARRVDLGVSSALVAPPVLVVEVLSPSTRAKDLVLKRALYAESGVPSYWIVDPEQPSVTVLELSEGSYVESHRVVGSASLAVAVPYSLTICPADLTR